MWRLVPFRVWLLAALVGVFAAACGGDEPAPAFEPQAVPASERVVEEDEPASRHAEDAELEAEPLEQASGAEEVEDSPQEQVEAQQSESRPIQAPVQSTRAQHEEEEPTEDLTDLTGVVLADADVRARPGLAWPMIERLTSGEPVVVLHRGGGWYRISYGNGLEGWMRSTAVDLGEIDGRSVLRQPAPAILADWRGLEYGVMGQSADGAEVRLLALDDEQSAILGAPRDEVTLLVDDLTLDDLPILIGDETVVFPGDDFRVGQGKILPKANEWMWLPWGWLLAHNDEYIWQWRPQTDELEFVRRPTGFAEFSRDGRYTAIAHLCPVAGAECDRDPYVIILPLDGSPAVSLIPRLPGTAVASEPYWFYSDWHTNLSWTLDNRAVVIDVALREEQQSVTTSLVFYVDGRVARFDNSWEAVINGKRCKPSSRLQRANDGGHLWLLAGNTMVMDAECTDEDGDFESVEAVYALSGEFLRLQESEIWWDLESDDEQIRAAAGADDLSDRLITRWSPTGQHALVFDLMTANVHI